MEQMEFLEQILLRIGDYLPEEGFEWEITSIVKNNNQKLDGLIIKREGDTMSPILYLQDYYDKFVDGEELDEILQEIVWEWQNQNSITLDPLEILDFERCRNHLFFRLVNFGLNNELWENTPYLPWEDLALTVRWLWEEEEEGIRSVLITKEELERWNVPWEMVVKQAAENTRRLFPMKIMPLNEVIGLSNKNEEFIYVLTNESELNGATCLSYEEELWEFAKKMQSNFYILPSSIHEVLLVRDTGQFECGQLRKTVRQANETVVREEEILSYQIYYLRYQTGEIQMIE